MNGAHWVFNNLAVGFTMRSIGLRVTSYSFVDHWEPIQSRVRCHQQPQQHNNKHKFNNNLLNKIKR